MAMFIYTRAATLKIYDDLKKFIFGFSVSTQGLYIIFLVYALAIRLGRLYVNIALLTVSLGYLVFMIINQVKENQMPKDAVNTVGRIYRILRICIKAFTLGLSLYSIHIATTHVTVISVTLAAMSIIAWLLSVMFELFRIVYERYYELIESAIAKDIYPFKKVINLIPGKKAEAPQIDENIDRKLSKLGGDLQTKINAEKLVKKAEKKEKRKAALSNAINRVKDILPIKRKNEEPKSLDADIEEKQISKKK